MSLYHYTCDHGRDAVGDAGQLLPGWTLNPATRIAWTARYVWLTDLDAPVVDALGLTRNFTACDRSAHRYKVAERFEYVTPYMSIRKHLTRRQREGVEESPGARLRHWFVSVTPVPVVYDPLGVATEPTEPFAPLMPGGVA